jgi:hypothetical protein
LATDRDGVAQAGRTLGGGDAHPVLTLAAEQLRRLTGDVTQPASTGPAVASSRSSPAAEANS